MKQKTTAILFLICCIAFLSLSPGNKAGASCPYAGKNKKKKNKMKQAARGGVNDMLRIPSVSHFFSSI